MERRTRRPSVSPAIERRRTNSNPLPPQPLDEADLQRTVRKRLPHLPQSHIFLAPIVPLLGHLHQQHRQSAQLRRQSHLLSAAGRHAARIHVLLHVKSHRSFKTLARIAQSAIERRHLLNYQLLPNEIIICKCGLYISILCALLYLFYQ